MIPLFKEWFRWIPPLVVEEVRNHLKEMLESGTIRPSQSAWCNSMVLVWKKVEACISVSIFAAWMLAWKRIPTPSQGYRRCWKTCWVQATFPCLDLKSAFWQINMEEVSKQYTTFTVDNLGFSECDWMPFGLCNAPATFQWLMQNCMGELSLIYCLIYLDDLIVFSQMAEEHLHWLHIMFNWLWEYNLKLKPSKCSLFKEEINYLAHWVPKWGIWPSNANLKAIAKCAPLQTCTKIRAFLGLMGHYRLFIKGFVRIAQLLN